MPEGNGSTSAFRFQWGNVSLEVEGDDELVEQGFELLKNDVLSRIDDTEAAVSIDDSQPESQTADRREGDKDAGPPTIAQYVAQKQPSSNMERAVVLAHYAREHKGQETLTGEQLEELINDAGIEMFSAADALYNAERNKDWTERVEAGTYELTARGENYVQTQLPPDDD